jgi:hypothetical protein
MPGSLLPPLTLAVLAALLVAAGAVAARSVGPSAALARRLAGARQVRVGELLDREQLPARPVRVVGRIRCPDPIVTARDDRLVALHRDVEVRLGNRWRTLERIRETRGFELWDHDGSLPMDPSEAAEPLIVIPHVWRGSADELTDAGHRQAVARLTAERGTGEPPLEARAVTRMLSVVERLLVLAVVARDPDGGVRLAPPRGGYVITALDLDDAMRLAAGPKRRLLLAGVGLIVVGCLGLLAALAWGAAAVLLG